MILCYDDGYLGSRQSPGYVYSEHFSNQAFDGGVTLGRAWDAVRPIQNREFGVFSESVLSIAQSIRDAAQSPDVALGA